MKTVVIFGGAGFVGRNVIRSISKKDFKIIVPYQSAINEAELRLSGTVGQIIPLKFYNITEPLIKKIIKESDIVMNLKTIWEEKKKSTYKKKIYDFNKNLIKLINAINTNKLYIFFSGLGVSEDSDSKRIRYIAKTEKYINNNCNNYAVIRPSVIIGGGDLFFKRLLPIFKYSLFIPIFGNGKARLQLVYINDVVLACEKIILKNKQGQDIYELAGEEIFSWRSLYEYVADCLTVKRIYISIPFVIANIGIYILSKTPFKLLTKEQLMLFKNDSIILNKYKTFNNLDITKQDSREIIKKIIIKNV